METWLAVVILCEVLCTLFILWGFMHEDKLIQFEDNVIFYFKYKIRKLKKLCEKLICKIKKAKRFCKVVKVNICAKSLEKEGFKISKERKAG